MLCTYNREKKKRYEFEALKQSWRRGLSSTASLKVREQIVPTQLLYLLHLKRTQTWISYKSRLPQCKCWESFGQVHHILKETQEELLSRQFLCDVLYREDKPQKILAAINDGTFREFDPSRFMESSLEGQNVVGKDASSSRKDCSLEESRCWRTFKSSETIMKIEGKTFRHIKYSSLLTVVTQ